MDKCYRGLLSFLRTIVNFVVVLISLPYIVRAKKFTIKGNGRLHILGNGPSLKNDYTALKSSLTPSDSMMVVNTFAATDLYEDLKPQYYIIADPSFFKIETEQRIIDIRNNTFEALVSKTQWELELFIPFSTQKSECLLILEKNKFIHLNFFLNVPIVDGSEKINHFLYKHGLANPPYRNVLIAALFYGIKLKFSNISIWGADHSWHEDFILGTDNKVYSIDRHFYGENTKGFAHLNQFGKPVKVHEEFYSIARTMKVYHSLDRFAHGLNCQIINRSSKTWIDAFKRE